ncbi:hypothetical protein ACFE04_015485 [Oxalis oulophora]
MKGVVISMVVVLAMIMMVMMIKPSEAAVSCPEVDSSVAPCVAYLTGGATPSAACCAGVTKITNIAKTIDDKRAACECLKIAATRIPNINQDAASALPQKCGVPFNIPISKNTNCAK